MYKILGADQKEYGPISLDQLKQWISEGRANAQTLVQLEGTTDWKPLSAYPELAGALAATPSPPPPTTAFAPQAAGVSAGREVAVQAVKGPAIGLMVTAIFGLIAVAFGLVMNLLVLSGTAPWRQQIGDPQMQKFLNLFGGGGLGIIQNIIGGIVGIVVLMGASKMQRLQNYPFVFTASILAMVPCVSPCCMLGLPFGIWALVILNKPEVKAAFH
jgi:hypothetical protein